MCGKCCNIHICAIKCVTYAHSTLFLLLITRVRMLSTDLYHPSLKQNRSTCRRRNTHTHKNSDLLLNGSCHFCFHFPFKPLLYTFDVVIRLAIWGIVHISVIFTFFCCCNNMLEVMHAMTNGTYSRQSMKICMQSRRVDKPARTSNAPFHTYEMDLV